MHVEQAEQEYDVVVIGGGQAGLSAGYYLRRTDLTYIILDGRPRPGGAWQETWSSLQLFSPAQWSSIPGWMFPGKPERYPTRDETISYLTQYEERYNFPILRPAHASSVKHVGEFFLIEASKGNFKSRAVISATGTWQNPFIPDFPSRERFEGIQIHSAHYHGPDRFAGKSVLIVGAGNSGAQIMAEVSLQSQAVWATLDEPQYLPDDVDGRVLFDRASERYRSLTQSGEDITNKPADLLGHIVMVDPVKAARDRHALISRRMFASFTSSGVIWNDGSATDFDAVIWCTGFRPSVEHLRQLNVINDKGRVDVEGNRSIKEPQLWMLGYGNWTGFASATLVGVGRSARKVIEEILSSADYSN